MFKITLIVVGKIKKDYENLEKEFTKRIKSFADLQTIEIPEGKTNDKERNKVIEGERILTSLPNGDNAPIFITLDEHGQELNSIAFANLLNNEKNFGKGKILFVIGGPYGLSSSILNQAKMKLSLSKMTFTHQMARLFFLEQLYRAFTIIEKKTYHY
ncbi:MAG: 50S rRNA methyltransferase [Candidatus Peregrinibacteria bacterium GW2011_GWF2_33_10]|nr:MAG: 50S rRNA methyltransferase [Candidatus Peregrinibacteria bacterium GW2011_GWF2_33_10]OGJ44452.1 MAG: hypothetical protein A2272_01250 [Candidatus Peregrinibacteria bacterium RIFOXYA12_FULL_33_12]OGJ45018.1 MAG: hypothetical protein A2263_03105 [Candidatus Peregrinibacteria bacterium RIFOXYA2_FULL_33_21]OGJ50636.1 MAG: hypothetical protein A2307_06145 [Candidatus Peregrinibacteria bacterium RIFOXYB2_FULL_33_20]